MIRSALRSAAALLPLLVLTAAAPPASAPVTPMTPDVVAKYDQVRPEADFIKRVVMVPMRDRVKLYTVIVMRKGTANGPILLSRTPYDAKGSTARTPSQSIVDILPIMDKEFVNDGYIRVYQDIRGKYGSEGDYVVTRPLIGSVSHETSSYGPSLIHLGLLLLKGQTVPPSYAQDLNPATTRSTGW